MGDLVGEWERIIGSFLTGGPAVPPELEPWFAGYQGKGRGEVDVDALPEPWIGRYDPSTCRAVMLGLNPGRANTAFQGRGGVFATEIATAGSFGEWASSWPYLRDPWVADVGPNRFHSARLAFLRRWIGEPQLHAEAMVAFEMYPWHSTSITAAMRPDPGLVRTWVLEPVRALGQPVFAFGAPWLELLPRLGLVEVDRLGLGGRPYGSEVASRTVAVFDLDGVPIVAEKHSGGAGPPSAPETEMLRDALAAR